MVKPTKILKDDWYAIPLKKFLFPLMVKNVEYNHEKNVRWFFGGFWRGVGEVNFFTENNKTIVEGFEYITPHGLWLFSSILEKKLWKKSLRKFGLWVGKESGKKGARNGIANELRKFFSFCDF